MKYYRYTVYYITSYGNVSHTDIQATSEENAFHRFRKAYGYYTIEKIVRA